MMTQNARNVDALESAYIADVKRVPCVVCDADAPSECHHPEQGLHYCGIACCKDCHGGPGYPHGWHGDKSRWRAAKMTPMKAMNETRRRVDRLRNGLLQVGTPSKRKKSSTATPKGETDLLPKIVKRRL